MPLKNWSSTAANNSSAPPYGAPESTTLVSDLNNIDRQVMADVRAWYENPMWRDLGLALQASGAANAVVFTGDVTALFSANQRLYVTDSSTSQYCTIQSVSLSTNTSVIVDITVTHPVSAVLCGIHGDNDPIPYTALSDIPYIYLPGESVGSGSIISQTLNGTVERIELAFAGISLDSVNTTFVQLGAGGFLDNSGYVGAVSNSTDNAAFSTGFALTFVGPQTNEAISGTVLLTRITGNLWSCSGSTAIEDVAVNVVSGRTTLDGPCNIVGLVHAGNFDGGTWRVMYYRSA